MKLLCCVCFFALAVATQAFTLPADSQQMVLGITKDWQSNTFTVQRFEKKAGGTWLPVGPEIPVRGGGEGLVWGRGLHPVVKNNTIKQEGDWKTPCGAFAIGGAYGYDTKIQKQDKLPYHQIISGDLWISDTKSPQYNQFIALGRPPANDWEEHEQMRLNDSAHSLKLFIAHNAAPDILPGAGSAIFFHIWRANGSQPTAGCTAMSEKNLKSLIAWIDPDKKPLYVLLPRSVYNQVKAEWKLP